MIVCSCRVLTDEDFTSTLASEVAGCPRSAVDAYRCLGCGPDCGRCLKTVGRILAEARAASRCHDCVEECALRDHHDHPEHAHPEMAPQIVLLDAAE